MGRWDLPIVHSLPLDAYLSGNSESARGLRLPYPTLLVLARHAY